MRRGVSTVVAIVMSLWMWPVAAQQPAQTLEYEVFCKLPDVQAKRDAFLATTAESRANLVRTQLERWRDANRASLNEKQVAALTALIGAVTADTYGQGPKAEEARVKARQVTETQMQLFTSDQIQAMQPNAPCIAKVK